MKISHRKKNALETIQLTVELDNLNLEGGTLHPDFLSRGIDTGKESSLQTFQQRISRLKTRY